MVVLHEPCHHGKPRQRNLFPIVLDDVQRGVKAVVDELVEVEGLAQFITDLTNLVVGVRRYADCDCLGCRHLGFFPTFRLEFLNDIAVKKLQCKKINSNNRNKSYKNTKDCNVLHSFRQILYISICFLSLKPSYYKTEA